MILGRGIDKKVKMLQRLKNQEERYRENDEEKRKNEVQIVAGLI
jgi:hypothetical protein